MGLLGTGNSTNKFCISKECKIAKHENQKFGFKPGLFIRVPKKGDQAYCSPSLQEEFLESDLIADFITELKTVQEWVSIFAQIRMIGIKIDATEWQEKGRLRQRAKSAKTPKKSKTQRSQAWGDLRNISADFDTLRSSLSSGTEEDSTIENRLHILEEQMRLLTDILEGSQRY